MGDAAFKGYVDKFWGTGAFPDSFLQFVSSRILILGPVLLMVIHHQVDILVGVPVSPYISCGWLYFYL